MLKNLQLFLLIIAVVPSYLLAQNTHSSTVNKAVLMDKVANPNTSFLGENNVSAEAQTRTVTQEEIGTTYFDNQTYGSAGHRLYVQPDGGLAAAWHFSTEPSGWSDRGTGSNNFDGAAWSSEERVEGLLRGGYPGFVATDAGDQFVSSHINEGVWQMGFHSKLAGETEWTVGSIPTNTGGTVWGKLAVSGENNDIIHAIGVTLSEDFGGMAYEGMAQHLLYYRSSDKGATWDIQDMILPEIDSTNYLTIEAESYTIIARGNTVAIVVFPSWGDARLLKSTDNGDTWEVTKIYDFPLDKYDDYVYSIEDTGMDINDPNLPDTLAILSTDNTASVVIDNDDLVHVAVGRMYVSADGSGDRFYFPATDGIFYWNENEWENGMSISVEAQDFNGNDSLDIEATSQIALYYRSLTGMPCLGVDADNTLYMTYSALNELYLFEEEDQFFRQIYISKKGADDTWSEPYAVINSQTINESFIPFTEGVFPSIPPIIGETIPLIYQQDFRPGMLTFGDEDTPELASIVYVDLTKEDFSIVSDLEQISTPLVASISPNPTSGRLFLEYQPEEATSVSYEVLNTLGAKVIIGTTQEAVSTFYRQEINLAGFPKGMYFVHLTAEDKSLTFKVVKE